MPRKKHISNKWGDHKPARQHNQGTTYIIEPLESRVLLSADLSAAVQALPTNAVETPQPAAVLNVTSAPATGQQTLSVAQMLAQPISFFPSAGTMSVSATLGQSFGTQIDPPIGKQATPSVSESLGQNQSVSQTVAPALQNQVSMPASDATLLLQDSTLLPQIGETGQNFVQPPTNELTTPTTTAPTTDQPTLSVAQMLAQPISLFPSTVTTNTSNVTELATNPPTNPDLSGSATTTPAPSLGSSAPAEENVSSPLVNLDPPVDPVLLPTQPISTLPPPMTNLGQPIDPALLSQWQQQMITFGQQHANVLSTLSGDAALGATYYDAARVFYQIADYTHDPSWLAAAHQATTIYRDQYVLPNNGAVPGYWNFTGGLLQDYQHTGDVRSKDAIILLSTNAAFAPDGTPLEWTASAAGSREVAYTIMSYLNAEAVGQPHRARLDDLVTQAIGHLDQWFVSKTAPYLQPFMAGLTMEALIQYNTAVGGDSRILPAIQSAVDSMWSHNWLPESQSFQYVDREVSGVGSPTPAPDLNMLIASGYAWMYHQTGNPMYQQEADAILKGGVQDAYLQGAKQFNQNYFFAFDFMTWRNS